MNTDLGYPTGAHGRIPSFANCEEEAEFRDTHDLTEFDVVERYPVEITIGGDMSERFTIRLDWAGAIGVGPSILVRMWVKEQSKQRLTGD